MEVDVLKNAKEEVARPVLCVIPRTNIVVVTGCVGERRSVGVRVVIVGMLIKKSVMPATLASIGDVVGPGHVRNVSDLLLPAKSHLIGLHIAEATDFWSNVALH